MTSLKVKPISPAFATFSKYPVFLVILIDRVHCWSFGHIKLIIQMLMLLLVIMMMVIDV